MPAFIPNTNTFSSQFQNNVFEKLKNKSNEVGKTIQVKHEKAINERTAARNAYAKSVNDAIKESKDQVTQQHGEALRMNSDVNAKAKFAQKAAKQAAANVKAGTSAPAQGAAPRTFAIPPAKQQKSRSNDPMNARVMQVNDAHREALKFQAAQFKTMQSQRNFAHGEALKEQNRKDRIAQKSTASTPSATSVSTPAAPSLAPQFSHPETASTPIKAQPIKLNGPQFSNVSHESNAPFPTHQHPEGSSNVTLPHLSESLSTPGRPNEFTVGSRAFKPGGIAARGSQLEAWAQTKSNAVQARQASRRAGGRDRSLATAAREWESASQQPMSSFAPEKEE